MGLQIASHWFELERLSDGVTRIWEPHVIRVMQCNVWHVQGRDRDLIIDTGMGIGSLTRAAADVFTKPLTAVATHTHLDHVGSLHEFSERVVHVAEADELKRPSANFSMLRDDHPAQFIAALEHAGYEVGSAFVTALPSVHFNLQTFARPPAPATRVVQEGDVVDLGDRVFEILHLPGHSPGGIGLWEAATGIFFSGDAIYDGPLLMNCLAVTSSSTWPPCDDLNHCPRAWCTPATIRALMVRGCGNWPGSIWGDAGGQ